MPLSSIAQLILRLYAIKLWIGSIPIMIGILVASFPIENKFGYLITTNLPNLFVVLCGFVLWQLSPVISRLLTKGDNRELSLSGVTSENLYTATLLGLGVFFILSSLASSFSWIHYLIIYNRDIGGFHMNQAPSYYDLTDYLLTLLAGLALTLTCRIWARRLAN